MGLPGGLSPGRPELVSGRGDSIASEMGIAWHVSPLDADSQGAIVQFVTSELTCRKAPGGRVPGPRFEDVPGSPRVVRTGLVVLLGQ